MDNTIAARSLIGMSLAFHIIFAVIGVWLPLLMTIAEWRWRATGDSVYLQLAKRWAKGATILFVVGSISGAVISFELGLLWPRFMQYAVSLIGMPFSLSGFAFFAEAIFLGIYLYGWKRGPGWFDLLVVAISGATSALFCHGRERLDEYFNRLHRRRWELHQYPSLRRNAESGGGYWDDQRLFEQMSERGIH